MKKTLLSTITNAANGLLANKLNDELGFVAVKLDESGKFISVTPKNGSTVLVHTCDPDDYSNDTAADEDPIETWEVMKWFNAGADVELGYKIPEGSSKKTTGNKLLDVLRYGKPVSQKIKESGFYWRDEDEDASEWNKVRNDSVDCWMALPSKTSKEDLLMAAGAGASTGSKSKEDQKEELMFQHSFRLGDGSYMIIKTIPSADWKDGSPLPDDVGAFKWIWIGDFYDQRLIDAGKLSARFKMPAPGESWDTVDMAENILRHVLKSKGINPDGAYDLIG